MKWLQYIFRPVRCVICMKRVKPNTTTGTVKYRYIEEGEAKISSGIVCKECLDIMEMSTPTEEVGELDETI
jgi:hypothetical protein